MKLQFNSGATLLALCLFFLSVVSKYVSVDESARANHFILVYTGMVPINENPNNKPSDQDLSNLARDAYIEMIKDFERRRTLSTGDPEKLPRGGLGRQPPKVMAALVNADRSRLYFSSSLKGSPDKIITLFKARAGQSNENVLQALTRCQLGSDVQITPDLRKQANNGGCGEIMALHTFYLDTLGNVDPRGSRMVAVESAGRDSELVIIKPFCKAREGGMATYGCSDLANILGIVGISSEPDNKPIGDVASLLGDRSAVEIC